MAKFMFSYSGAMDIEAETQDAAEKEFFSMTDKEIGHTIEEFDGVQEIEETCGNCGRKATRHIGEVNRCERCAEF